MAAPERRYTGDSRVNYRKEDRKREREREREAAAEGRTLGVGHPYTPWKATRVGGGRRKQRNISFHPLSPSLHPSHSVAHCPISDAHIIAAAKESLERNFKVRRLVWRPASAHVTNYLFCQACAQPSPRGGPRPPPPQPHTGHRHRRSRRLIPSIFEKG